MAKKVIIVGRIALNGYLLTDTHETVRVAVTAETGNPLANVAPQRFMLSLKVIGQVYL